MREGQSLNLSWKSGSFNEISDVGGGLGKANICEITEMSEGLNSFGSKNLWRDQIKKGGGMM